MAACEWPGATQFRMASPSGPDPFGSIMTSKRQFVNHFLMETIITTEQDLMGRETLLPTGVVMVHFKLVGIGPNALAQAGYLGRNICDVVRQQPGFFIVSLNGLGLREAMHDLVDRFCDVQEEKNESTNS